MKELTRKGLFVTFEGLEYCGKSTQMNLLDKRLKQNGFDVNCYREPESSDLGNMIRTILFIMI